ncbi:MAG: phosphatase family protein [Amycolatopsis sp.]|jgi:membrane-associated phospholipid phosphatase|nr:phosphatase family protein [Amycolatopsis sp.]
MIDSGWYRDVTEFASATKWLNGTVVAFTTYGVFVLVLVILAMGWWARRRGVEAMAGVLWVPIAMGVAYLLNSVIKSLVAEPRPCRVVPGVHTVLPCDGPTDYSFPSNHTVIVAAFAAAVLLLNRRWGLFALVFALVMALTRVYVGAHYPHDVLAGFVIGLAVGACGVFTRKPLEHALERVLPQRLRSGSANPPSRSRPGLPSARR